MVEPVPPIYKVLRKNLREHTLQGGDVLAVNAVGQMPLALAWLRAET